MHIVKIVADMRQILARNVQVVWCVHVARRQNDGAAVHLTPAAARLGGDHEAVAHAPDICHRLIGVDLQVELLGHAAQIDEILLAGGAPLGGILDRNAGNLDTLGGAEKGRVARPPGDGMAQLARVELHIIDAGALQTSRQFQPDGPRADDHYVG